jgi:hypothetical protein
MKLYVIRATNQLTGEREAISVPRSYYKTRKILQKWKAITKDCQDPAWTNLKVEHVVS